MVSVESYFCGQQHTERSVETNATFSVCVPKCIVFAYDMQMYSSSLVTLYTNVICMFMHTRIVKQCCLRCYLFF